VTDDIKIIFLRTAASHPVKNSAQNLKKMSFLSNSLKEKPSAVVSKIYLLPKIMSTIPKNSIGRGVSPIKRYPKSSPTKHLYELIGAKTDISPSCRALIKQTEPNVHKIPARIT
jgi:hypothetical protein